LGYTTKQITYKELISYNERVHSKRQRTVLFSGPQLISHVGSMYDTRCME